MQRVPLLTNCNQKLILYINTLKPNQRLVNTAKKQAAIFTQSGNTYNLTIFNKGAHTVSQQKSFTCRYALNRFLRQVLLNF